MQQQLRMILQTVEQAGIDYYKYVLTKVDSKGNAITDDDGNTTVIEKESDYACTTFVIGDLEYGAYYSVERTAYDVAGNSSSATNNGSTFQISSQATLGDFVYYPIDLNGDGDYTNDWRLFYVTDDIAETWSELKTEDSNGDITFTTTSDSQVFLIAADYVAWDASFTNDDGEEEYYINRDSPSLDSSTYTISGGIGSSYIVGRNYVTYWKSLTTLFSSYSAASSYGMDEVYEKYMLEWRDYMQGYTDLNGSSRTVTWGNTNIKHVNILLATELWSNFVDDDYAADAVGASTVEMWTKAWNKRDFTYDVYYSEYYTTSDTDDDGETTYTYTYSSNGYYIGRVSNGAENTLTYSASAYNISTGYDSGYLFYNRRSTWANDGTYTYRLLSSVSGFVS